MSRSRERKYVSNRLGLPTIVSSPARVFEIYGEVLNCLSSEKINKEELISCIRSTVSPLLLVLQQKVDTSKLALIYNDLRRLGVISIGHGGNWRDEEAKLTTLGELLLKYRKEIKEREKLGACMFYLCHERGNEVNPEEAGVCYSLKSGDVSYHERTLLERAKRMIEADNKVDFSFIQNLGLFDFAVLATLVSGKNLLLVGKPGTGKTRYLVDLLNKLGIDYELHTAHAEWTAYDVVGGLTVSGKWRPGFLTKAVMLCNDELKTGGRPHWVLIDEINRADIDRALGIFFTMLDVEYRSHEFKIDDAATLRVPYAFRVLATMNSYDRSLLFKLGYALRRRFAIIEFERVRNIDINYPKESFKKKLLGNQECRCEEIDISKVLFPLLLSDGKNDYVLIFSSLYKKLHDWKLREKQNDVFNIIVEDIKVDLRNILCCIINDLNNTLSEFNNCEVCPISTAPGVVADALRFLVAITLLCDAASTDGKQSGFGLCNKLESWIFFLDFALATYIIPQLEIIAEYIQIGKSRKKLREISQNASKKLSEYGMRLSAEYLSRLSKGYNIL